MENEYVLWLRKPKRGPMCHLRSLRKNREVDITLVTTTIPLDRLSVWNAKLRGIYMKFGNWNLKLSSLYKTKNSYHQRI